MCTAPTAQGWKKADLVKCCSPKQGWALGELGRKQARRGHRSQAFRIGVCPAMCLVGTAAEGGLATLSLALTSHQPPIVREPAPNQHCRTGLLTAEDSRPMEFIQDRGFNLVPQWKPHPEPEGFLLRQEALRPATPQAQTS